MPDEQKPWVTMTHPDAGVAMSSREGFDALWADKGWTITDEHDEPPTLAGETVEPEHDGAGNPVDPERLTKVLAGEVTAADVGVDPRVETDGQMWTDETPAPDAPAPAPPPPPPPDPPAPPDPPIV